MLVGVAANGGDPKGVDRLRRKYRERHELTEVEAIESGMGESVAGGGRIGEGGAARARC